ncbi:MAG: hypothetical protein R3D70_11115 [Rhizobiaceae bacterium]
MRTPRANLNDEFMVGRAQKRVLITGGRMPVSVQMAQIFMQAGARVHVADSTRHVIADALSECTTHRLPGARGNMHAYGAAVEDLVRQWDIDIVVPVGEEIFHLAAARETGYAIPLFAPPLATLRLLHDKSTFIELARSRGLAVPETWVLKRRKDVDDLAERSGELVLKPCFSRFGARTKIGVKISELDDVVPSAHYPWVAQERLDGEEFCAYAVAVNGKLAAFSAYRPSHRIAKSAAFYFEPCKLPDGERIAAVLAAATAFTGQISLDFIRIPEGTLLPIECNPRATSGLHFFWDQPELATAILRATAPEIMLRPRPATPPAMHRRAMWIAGLPNALRSGTSLSGCAISSVAETRYILREAR